MRLVVTNCGEIQRVPHRLEHVRVVVRHELVHDLAVDGEGVVEALVALDELLDRDRRALARRSRCSARSSSASLSTRTAPEAPAPSRGLRMSGKPTRSANACASAGGRRGGLRPRARRRRAAPPSSPACRGTGTRCARGARDAAASRACAAGMMWASTVASSASIHTCPATSARRRSAASTCHRAHLLVAVERPCSSSPRFLPRLADAVTLAPTDARARTNRRWFAGNSGSTKMTFTPPTLGAGEVDVTGSVRPACQTGRVVSGKSSNSKTRRTSTDNLVEQRGELLGQLDGLLLALRRSRGRTRR